MTRILLALLLIVPAQEQDEDERIRVLEKELERALGDVQSSGAPIVLADAEKLIALKPDEGKYHFARGMALHHLLRFEEALAAYEKAGRLGLTDEDSPLPGNPLGDWKKWSKSAMTRVPPIVWRHPDQDRYKVCVRSFTESRITRTAQSLVPDLVRQGEEWFGRVPEGTSIFVVPSLEDAEEIEKETQINLVGNKSGLRPDAPAFGNALGCYLYENHPKKDTPVDWADERLRRTIAHELCHGIAIRNRVGNSIYHGVPAWFEEGLAVYFEHVFFRIDEKAALAEFVAAAKAFGGAPERANLVGGTFQNVPSAVRLNYITASFMIRRLEARKGRAILRTLNDSCTRPYDSEDLDDFSEMMEKKAGINAETLFEETLKYLKDKLGRDYPAEKQYSDPWKEEVTGRMGGAKVKKIITQEASFGGIYSDFLYAMHAPEAADDYGRTFEGGYIDPKEKGVQTEAPAGYWVYYEPYWIVWGKKKKE